jgi:hypothetical protein
VKFGLGLLLFCLIGTSSPFAQSLFLDENSSGTLVTFDYHVCFEADTLVGGMGIALGYSYLGKYEASISYSTVGGLSPVYHNNRIFESSLGYYFLKQGRESQNPFSMAIRFGFDALISDAGTYRYSDESDPSGVVKLGIELSRRFGSWRSFVQPTVGLLRAQPTGGGFEAKLESQFGLAIMVASGGNDNFVLFPQYAIYRDVHELTFRIGFIFR